MQADRLAAGFNLAGVRYHIQPAEDSRQLVERDAAGGHFRQRDIDVDLLRDRPADGDFADAGNQHQFAAQLLGVANQFRIGKAIAGDSKEEAKDIAKIIIYKRGGDAGRKLTGGVAHPAAQFIPDLRQLAGVVVRGDIDGDLRQAVGGDRTDVVEIRQLLQRVFERQGDFFFNLLCRRAGIMGDHHGGFDGKRRVFQTANIQQGEDPPDAQQQNSQPDADRVVNKLAGDIHYKPRSRVQIRTGCCACNSLTPAATTRSPTLSPSVITTP